MKDYKCTFAQYLHFVVSVEGDSIDNTIWFSNFRIRSFIKVMKCTGKAPNTIANKAKGFCEVCICYNYLSILINYFISY